MFSGPSGKEKPVCDLKVPDIRVTGRAVLSPITTVQPYVMGQIVIQTEIELIHVCRWEDILRSGSRP